MRTPPIQIVEDYCRCEVCGVVVKEISKATPPGERKCRKHGTWGGDPESRERRFREFIERTRKERER